MKNATDYKTVSQELVEPFEWCSLTRYNICEITDRQIKFKTKLCLLLSRVSQAPTCCLVSQTGWGHDDVIKWKHFPRYWPFVREIHRSPVNSPHKGQWRGPLMFSLICAWIHSWVNNGEAGDLRHHRSHYDVTVMEHIIHIMAAKSDSSFVLLLILIIVAGIRWNIQNCKTQLG